MRKSENIGYIKCYRHTKKKGYRQTEKNLGGKKMLQTDRQRKNVGGRKMLQIDRNRKNIGSIDVCLLDIFSLSEI